MKIEINDISSKGVHKEAEYNPCELDLEIEASKVALPVKFITPINISADINLAGKELVVRSILMYKLQMICSRCLEKFDLLFEGKHIFTYNIQNLETVDVTNEVREEIILDYPLKPLCSKDCRGICIKCRVNLNMENCKCGDVKLVAG